MKLWGGRFGASLDEIAALYNQSLSFDQRLAEEDVRGSIAWAQGLEKAGVLTGDETRQIVDRLDKRFWLTFWQAASSRTITMKISIPPWNAS